MKTVWMKGISDKQVKDDVRASFKASQLIRARLADILEGKSKEAERASMDADGYECANWAYKMADAQGYKRALNEIISLLIEK